MSVRIAIDVLVRPATAILAAAGFALLGGCGLANDTPVEDSDVIASLPDAQASPAPDCLLVIWDEQDAPNRDFDRAHDRVEGGAISCATGTSASAFEAALADIRAAAAQNDRAALIRELGIPLLYIDSEGERRDVLEDELVEAGFDEVFSPEMVAIMQDLQLDDMTVVPEQGAFFELGSLWLVADRRGGRPRIITVNRQALDEAALAARQGAADAQKAEHEGR